MSNTRTISNSSELESLRAEASVAGIPLIVDIWAKWCGPCKAYGPIFETAAERNPGLAIWAKLEFDGDGEAVAEAFGVKHLPCTLKFSADQPVEKISGTRPGAFLDELCAQRETVAA